MACAHDYLPVLSNSDIEECTACGAVKLATVKDVKERSDTWKKKQIKDHEN